MKLQVTGKYFQIIDLILSGVKMQWRFRMSDDYHTE